MMAMIVNGSLRAVIGFCASAEGTSNAGWGLESTTRHITAAQQGAALDLGKAWDAVGVL